MCTQKVSTRTVKKCPPKISTKHVHKKCQELCLQKMSTKSVHKSGVGWGDKWALMELSFTHITSKTWAHSRKFGFFRKISGLKKAPPRPNHFLKIRLEIHFLERHFWDESLQKKIQNCNYIALYQKTAFGFDPGPWEVPKPEITRNTQIHVFACFLVRALPEVRDQI